MDMDTILSIFKWIALAFTAGLIGYFGKHFGKVIVARFSRATRSADHLNPREDSGEGKNNIPTYNNKKEKSGLKV
jgi:hypothetical protein